MSKKITTEDFVCSMQQINPSIEILGEYVAAKKPIHCRCLKCGFEWDPTPSNLKKGRGCQKCSGHYHRTLEEFVSEVARKNPSIEILGKYVDMHEPIEVRCKICGKRWSPVAQSVLVGYACKDCGYKKISAKLRLSPNEIVQRMQDTHPEIEVIGKYIDADTPVKCRCTICGYEWERKGKQLQVATGCPNCLHQLPLTHEEFVKRIKGHRFYRWSFLLQ